MKRMLFVVTLLSLFNAEVFASQPQPARTPSWWSWAPYAAGTVALAGTGLGVHYYKKYSRKHTTRVSELQQGDYDKQERKLKAEIGIYEKTLNEIMNSASSLQNDEDKEGRVQSIKTQIKTLIDGMEKDQIAFTARKISDHLRYCSTCTGPFDSGTEGPFNSVRSENLCILMPDYVKTLNKKVLSAIDNTKKNQSPIDAQLKKLQAEQKRRLDAVQSLKTKKNIALATSLACGGSFVGLAGVGIYNWWNRNK